MAPAQTGIRLMKVKSGAFGSRINQTPIAPKKTATILRGPILSLKRIVENINTKTGEVKRPAAAMARGIMGSDPK